jgi:hypothetical protein
MKNVFLFIMLISSSISYANKKPKYTVLNIPKTIIKTPLEFLNVGDTINKNRNISNVSDNLGGLTPRYPMALSYEYFYGPVYDFVGCFKKFHTLLGHCYNYLIEKNDSIVEINSQEKFKEIFAPVESKEEALSFAYALCGCPFVTALYDFSFLNNEGEEYEIYRKELRPTSVQEVSGGYEVVLFDTFWDYISSCSEVIIYVSRQGDVKVLKTERLYHNKNNYLIED